MKVKRAIVLGASGLMGIETVRKLDALGTKVVAVDRKLPGRLAPEMRHVEWRHGSITDSNLLESAIKSGDDIFHFAESSYPGHTNEWEEGLKSLELLKRICCLAAEGNCRIIYPSSGGTVYGHVAQVPIAENAPLEPISKYGFYKKLSEEMIQFFGRVKALRFVIMRVSNCYGTIFDPQKQQGIVGVVANRMRLGEPVYLMGEGKQIRDFVHARDIAELCSMIFFSNSNGLIVNAGTGIGFSMLEVIEIIAKQLKYCPKFEYLPDRLFDVDVNILNPSKAKKTLGWAAKISFEDGVREICNQPLRQKPELKE